MITREQYFGDKPRTDEQEVNAQELLDRVNALLEEFMTGGGARPLCPNTGTEISGSKGGSGAGGFRLPDEGPTEHSSHKILWAQEGGRWVIDVPKAGAAVDDYDPGEWLDSWLDRFEDGHGGNSKLEEYGLYREAPESTLGWCHLTTRAPASGHRTFIP